MPSVLVTGAGRGIGKSIVEYLATRGWDVIAGVRTKRDAAAVTALDTQRISSVILDVTDAEHIAALDELLPERLNAIVNNAGVVVGGPTETDTTEDWRKQLEINVIGQLAVTRAVLPRLRESRGRVVFMSSLNGRVSMPLIGAYCASKFALEAAANALRMELRPWHIDVAIVEPAQTDTDMWRTADDMVEQFEAALTAEQRDLYARHIAGLKKSIPVSQKLAVPAEKVSAVVAKALTARSPRSRYVVGVGPKLQVSLMTNLPTSLSDFVLRRIAGQP
jgi:NAD(P)-dependent dehydrogenase (short-subunit alcohol dehydrogenase family)